MRSWARYVENQGAKGNFFNQPAQIKPCIKTFQNISKPGNSAVGAVVTGAGTKIPGMRG